MVTGLLIVFPILMFLLLVGMRHKNPKWLALGGAVIELGLSLYAWSEFDPNGGRQFELFLMWRESIGMTFFIGIDGISLPLVLLTTILVPLIILSSSDSKFQNPKAFYGLVLLMEAALIGVFVSFDALLFYVFWELALIPIYLICLMWGGENRGKITLKFFLYTLAGSLAMLVAIIAVSQQGFEIGAIYETGRSLPPNVQSLVFWGLFLAFAIKMPVFPFHTWQPDTYTVAPTQGTMLLSAIMLKMGIYGVIRWLIPVVPEGVAMWSNTVIVLSVAGVIYGSLMAIVQKDLKRLVAYSSIAHVGLISAGVMTQTVAGLQGAMIQMFSHGLTVFGLFYVVDIISERTKTRSLDELGGIRNVAPQFTTVFIIIMLGSVALPLTSGFIGEFLLIRSLVEYQIWIGAIAGLTIIFGAVYMLVAFQKSMSGEKKTLTETFKDLTITEKIILYPLSLLIIGVGVYPTSLLSISEATVTQLLDSLNELSSYLHP